MRWQEFNYWYLSLNFLPFHTMMTRMVTVMKLGPEVLLILTLYRANRKTGAAVEGWMNGAGRGGGSWLHAWQVVQNVTGRIRFSDRLGTHPPFLAAQTHTIRPNARQCCGIIIRFDTFDNLKPRLHHPHLDYIIMAKLSRTPVPWRDAPCSRQPLTTNNKIHHIVD